jgi:phage baseplate assembly protein V
MTFPTDNMRLLLNLIRKGTVIEVDHDDELCRVECGDIQTNWIRWIALAAGDTRDWNPPTVNEQVLVLSPGGDMADGIVLRGISSEEIPLPSHSPNTHTRTYPDGASIQYDHVAHALVATLPAGGTVLIEAPGSVTIKTSTATVEADQATVKANSITLDAPMTTCTGALSVKGAIEGAAGMKVTGMVAATGDVKAGDISLLGHHHKENGNITDGPQ